MLQPAAFPFAFEFDVVERTIVVAVILNGEETRVRLEALRARDGRYSTQACIERHVQLLQPGYAGDTAGPDARAWVAYELAWTSSDSADGALAAALSFLGERCANAASVAP